MNTIDLTASTIACTRMFFVRRQFMRFPIIILFGQLLKSGDFTQNPMASGRECKCDFSSTTIQIPKIRHVLQIESEDENEDVQL